MSFYDGLTNVYLPSIRFSDCIEILLFIFLVYNVIIGLRNTRAMIVLKGILFLFVLYNIAYILQFDALLVVFNSLITLFMFSIMVVFQPEMRKLLEQVGVNGLGHNIDMRSLFNRKKAEKEYYSDIVIEEMVKSCFEMKKVKTGALIVIEREIPLIEYMETGIYLNADVSSQLILNTFEKNTPLHDGAVIMQGNKLVSATCYLPLSNNMHISKSKGTRHRAAIGVSEVTDCIVLIVSEETGAVSVSVNGELKVNLKEEGLRDFLKGLQKKSTEEAGMETETTKKSWTRADWINRVLSICVGFVGWLLLMNIANPLTTVTITDVPINFINSSVITATGNTFDETQYEMVSVKVTDTRSVVDSLILEDITVTADLSKLSYVNAVPLEGSVSNTTSTVDVETESITIYLEPVSSKEFDIVLTPTSSWSNNTFVSDLISDTQSVILTGAKSVIDKVGVVEYVFDTSGVVAGETYYGSELPRVYDKNGSELDIEQFNVEDLWVSVSGVAKNVKEIEIDTVLSDMDSEGYSIVSAVCSPSHITISGDDEVLEGIDLLSLYMLEYVDMENVTQNEYSKTISIVDLLPEGVSAVDTFEINVDMVLEPYESKVLNFDKHNIEFVGSNEDYSYIIEDRVFSIEVSGSDEILSTLSDTDIIPFLNVSDIPEGSYNLIMQFEGLEDVKLISNISVRVIIEAVDVE